MGKIVALFAVVFLSLAPADAQTVIPTIETKTQGLQKLDGFFPLYWEVPTGTLWLEIPKFDAEVLYVTALSSGLGSNDIGLDRGQLGGEHIVTFKRIGSKVLMIEPNYAYRALSTSADERRAVEEAFAKSVLWGFTVAAESSGRVLVDASEFLLRDVHGVVQRLRPATYRIDSRRSAINMDRTKAFPKNTELDVLLTFTSDGGNEAQAGGGAMGGRLTDVTPSPQAVTLHQHHSFVELPGAGYEPLVFDPRAGAFGISYFDFASPISEPITKRFISRHRLQKRDPSAAVSEPVQPTRLLPRSGHARADTIGTPRRRALVESGVRGGRVPQCVPCGNDAGRRGFARHPVQRDPVGASIDPRVELRGGCHRSAHGRDPQGTCDARIAARAPGLLDCGRAALAVRNGKRDPPGVGADGACAAAAALGARGRPHARLRAQLLQQQSGTHLGDGLPASARHLAGRTARSISPTRMRTVSVNGTRSRFDTPMGIFRREPAPQKRERPFSQPPRRAICAI